MPSTSEYDSERPSLPSVVRTYRSHSKAPRALVVLRSRIALPTLSRVPMLW